MAYNSNRTENETPTMSRHIPRTIRGLLVPFQTKTETLPLYLAVIGTGLVGGELLSQIASLACGTARFKVIYIASSKKSVLALRGIDLSNWQETLAASSDEPTLSIVFP